MRAPIGRFPETGLASISFSDTMFAAAPQRKIVCPLAQPCYDLNIYIECDTVCDPGFAVCACLCFKLRVARRMCGCRARGQARCRATIGRVTKQTQEHGEREKRAAGG